MLTPGGQCATATSPELQDGGGPTTVDSPRAQQNSLGFRAFQLQDSTRSSIFFFRFSKADPPGSRPGVSASSRRANNDGLGLQLGRQKEGTANRLDSHRELARVDLSVFFWNPNVAWRVCSKSLVTHQVESRKQRGIHTNHQIFLAYMGMDQYLLIPFLGGWTSIYQLFWCSPGVQGFDTLPHHLPSTFWKGQMARPASPRSITTWFAWAPRSGSPGLAICLGHRTLLFSWFRGGSVPPEIGGVAASRPGWKRFLIHMGYWLLMVIDGYWWLLMVIDGYWVLWSHMNQKPKYR